MSGIVGMITGSTARKQAAAQARAAAQTEALQARQQLAADKRETELSGQDSALRRTAAARRRGRGQTAYNGPLKSTLGG